MSKRAYGFTIIELLVVIVVIAILAAITVVAYTGIQDRATNVSRISAARNMLTILDLYRTTNQGYPVLPDLPIPRESTKAACLGSEWPEKNGQKVCWNIYTEGEPGPSTFAVSSEVNAALANVGNVPDFPTDSTGRVADSNGRMVDVAGLILVHRTSPSTEFPLGYSLAYALKGSYESTDCGVPGAVASDIRDVITRCVVALPR